MKFPYSRILLGQAGKVRCEPAWSLGPDWSARLADCDLWYVWAGRGAMQLQEREIQLVPGVCLWMRPGRRYAATHDPANPLGVSYIHFTPWTRSGRPCLSHARLPDEVFHVRDALFFSMLMSRIVEELRTLRTQLGSNGRAVAGSISAGPAVWLFQALLHDFLTGDPRANPGREEEHVRRVKAQVAAIYEQPRNAPTVRRLAAEASLSADHYTRIFRRVNGVGPRELIQQAKLERAKQLLRETSLPIAEVAEQAGYVDPYQFSRMFRGKAGVPPSNWRKNWWRDQPG